MDEIRHPYGETIRHRITIKNTVLDGMGFADGDVVYLALRDTSDALVWWHTYEPMLIGGAWEFDWVIDHDEAEGFDPGRYKWGLSIYRDATIVEGRPVDGIVTIPVSRGDLIITPAVSREGD
jgi:hypothetical protein